MEEITAKGKEKATDDAFFLERLEMLYEQNLADMRAFADREGKPFDEVCGCAGGQCMYFLSASGGRSEDTWRSYTRNHCSTVPA